MKPTTKELLADEGLLRSTAGKVLKPGPSYHRPIVPLVYGNESEPTECAKCRKSIYDFTKQTCAVPDIDDRPMECIMVDLVRKLDMHNRAKWNKRFMDFLEEYSLVDGDTVYKWLGFSTGAQIVCLLVALGEAVMEDGQ